MKQHTKNFIEQQAYGAGIAIRIPVDHAERVDNLMNTYADRGVCYGKGNVPYVCFSSAEHFARVWALRLYMRYTARRRAQGWGRGVNLWRKAQARAAEIAASIPAAERSFIQGYRIDGSAENEVAV